MVLKRRGQRHKNFAECEKDGSFNRYFHGKSTRWKIIKIPLTCVVFHTSYFDAQIFRNVVTTKTIGFTIELMGNTETVTQITMSIGNLSKNMDTM